MGLSYERTCLRRVRRAILLTTVIFVFPTAAGAAVFTTPTYNGQTVTTSSPGWGFVSSSPQNERLGGVAYELSTDHVWHRCIQWGSASLSNLQPGTYSITISDDYSPVWFANNGLLGSKLESELCTDGPPSGENLKTDSLTIAKGGPGLPENRPTQYVPTAEPIDAHEQKVSEELTAKAEAAQAAKEAQVKAEQEANAAQNAAQMKQLIERAEREAAAAQAAESKASHAKCVVPALIGHSLRAAQHALAKAHCRLGKVTGSRTGHGTLLIISQSAKHGKKLSRGARVAVTLGTAEP